MFAVYALGSALQLADADVVGSANSTLVLAARRISTAYASQISMLRSDLALPLSRQSLDGYGRRVVTATIGDNEGIDGGLFLTGLGILGDGPQPVSGARERAAVADLAREVAAGGAVRSATVTLANGDLVAIDAVPLSDGRGVAWTRERINASALRGRQAAVPLIGAAIAACIILVAIGAWIILAIRRDARAVLDAIVALEADPSAQPALPRGDFGAIARAVKSMAERRAAAEMLAQRSERLAAIGRLAANAAHEIRNPLNALRLQAEVLRRRSAPDLGDYVTKLRAEIERLDAVVSGMLEVGADRPVASTLVDLRDVTRRAIDVLEVDASQRDRTIQFDCTAERTTVRGDAGRLVQLAINILANAVDAAPSHSAVDVSISAGPVLRVVDRGSGISAKNLPQVFEPFFSMKKTGTGLGLAIAHEIARAHGARIDVTSVPGETAFAIDFKGSPHE